MGPIPQPEEERDRPGHQNNGDIEDTEYPDVIINAASDSDDDDDDDDVQDNYVGYQALSQNIDETNTDTDSDESDDSPQFEQLEQNENLECTSEAQCPTSSSTIQVSEGILHQVRHPNYPNVDNLPGYMQVPDLPRPDRKELLWNQPRHPDQMLDTGNVDKIKSVMSGIQLPSTNIPDWARNLSDEQWQSQVVSKLVNSSTSLEQEVGESCDTNIHISAEDNSLQQNYDESKSDPTS
ncbi:hypothetical protein ACF0H5_003514 [Mactra antiquata]